MTNALQYAKHKLYTPDFYDRDYKNDFPKKEGVSFPLQFGIFKKVDIKRISLIALPFIALFSIPGKILSLTMNGIRSFTNISNIYAAKALSYEQFTAFFQLSLAVISIVGTFFSFKIGMMITGIADSIQNFKDSISHFTQKEYAKAVKELLLTVSSLLYIGIICFGSLEIVLVCLLVKGIVCLYEAGIEIAHGGWKKRWPEIIAKFAMGMIRFKGAHTQFKHIQRRNFLNQLTKFQSLLEKIRKSKKVDSLYDHPLTSLESKIENGKVIFYDDEGNSYDFGSHFQSLGGGLVKGMNITFRTVDDYTEIEFKINHVFRDKIQESIQYLKKLQRNPKELKEVLDLNKAKIEHLKITTEDGEMAGNWWVGFHPKTIHKIDVGGKAMIEIGADPRFINSYDKVKITLGKGQSVYDLHQTLSFLGLEDALKQSSSEDLQRMKLGHLFHTLSPEEAYKLERSEDFFELTIEELKARIIETDPTMKEKIDLYLDKMQLKDILPGRGRMHIEGLTDELKKQFSNFHLTTMLMGADTKEESFSRLSSIMQMGLFSKEMKDSSGMTKKGLINDHDHFGANDSTFVQMVTSQKSYDEFMYSWWANSNSIRLIIDPKILESGTYQYHTDICGHRLPNESIDWFDKSAAYPTRDGIEEFTRREFESPAFDNEVMIKDRISPEYIKGIVVDNEEMKQSLLDYMTKFGHFENGLLFGRDVNDFIQVGQDIAK